ncbi:MAG: hypothetical protein P8P83_06000 [Rickettsiaceae bacterium]|nr:hypothetical protein [Rickettsiaceae bacterium]
MTGKKYTQEELSTQTALSPQEEKDLEDEMDAIISNEDSAEARIAEWRSSAKTKVKGTAI